MVFYPPSERRSLTLADDRPTLPTTKKQKVDRHGGRFPPLDFTPSTPLPRQSAIEREAQFRGLPPSDASKDPFANAFDKSDNTAATVAEEFKAANNHPKVPGELNRKPHRLVQGFNWIGKRNVKPNIEETEFRLSFGVIGGEMYGAGTTFQMGEEEVSFYDNGDKFLASFMISEAANGKVPSCSSWRWVLTTQCTPDGKKWRIDLQNGTLKPPLGQTILLIIGDEYLLDIMDKDVRDGGRALQKAFGALVDQMEYLLF
jgi:hypothetical protein